MKAFISSAIIMLALYAQASSAQEPIKLASFKVLSQHNLVAHTQVNSVQPSWFMNLNESNYQLTGFLKLDRTHLGNALQQHHKLTASYGFGVHYQMSPSIYSQLVWQQADTLLTSPASIVKVGIGF